MPLYVLHHLRPPPAIVNGINEGRMGSAAAGDAIQRAMIGGDATAALALGFYRPVATVRCSGLDELFRLTNHIDSDWTKNPGVLDVAHPARSTSMGDLAFSLSDETVSICAMLGWRPLPDESLARQVISSSRDFLDRLANTQRS
mgnify:CR=1 FL=1